MRIYAGHIQYIQHGSQPIEFQDQKHWQRFHEKYFYFRHPLTMKYVLCTDSIHRLCEANVAGA